MSIVDDKIAESQKEFSVAINKLKRVMMLSLKFDLDKDGNIEPTKENLDKIVNIDVLYQKALIESGYTEAVESYLEKESEIIIEALS